MDRKLLDLLCSPDTRQPLAVLEPRGLEALNRAIAAGQVRRGDGSTQSIASLRTCIPHSQRAVTGRA